jgi:hypothetical protein
MFFLVIGHKANTLGKVRLGFRQLGYTGKFSTRPSPSHRVFSTRARIV